MEPYFVIRHKTGNAIWKEPFETKDQANNELIAQTKKHGNDGGWYVETRWRQNRNLSEEEKAFKQF